MRIPGWVEEWAPWVAVILAGLAWYPLILIWSFYMAPYLAPSFPPWAGFLSMIPGG